MMSHERKEKCKRTQKRDSQVLNANARRYKSRQFWETVKYVGISVGWDYARPWLFNKKKLGSQDFSLEKKSNQNATQLFNVNFFQFITLREVVYKYQHKRLRINIWKMQYNV